MGVFLIVAAVVSMRMAEGIPSHTGTTEIQAYRYYIEQLQGTYTEETRAWAGAGNTNYADDRSRGI